VPEFPLVCVPDGDPEVLVDEDVEGLVVVVVVVAVETTAGLLLLLLLLLLLIGLPEVLEVLIDEDVDVVVVVVEVAIVGLLFELPDVEESVTGTNLMLSR